MNYKEKHLNFRKVRDYLVNNYPEGCLKITSGEGHIHARTKAEVFHWLKSNCYQCYSEANLKGSSGRPDIIAINDSGYAYIIEIVSSESEKSLISKSNKYPSEFDLIVVYTKDFNYDNFKL